MGSLSICRKRREIDGKEKAEEPGKPEEAEEDVQGSKDEQDCKDSWKPLV